MNEDGELVRQARSGDGTAYGELVRRWSARVMAMCRARLRSVHAAEDAAQEAFLRGFRALGSLEDDAKYGAWIRGIAHRVCLDWWKSKQNGQVPFSAWLPSGTGETAIPSENPVGEDLEREEETGRLLEELETLDVDRREVLMLYYSHGLTYRELAELLGVSVGTINARLTSAREQLRRRLMRSEVR